MTISDWGGGKCGQSQETRVCTGSPVGELQEGFYDITTLRSFGNQHPTALPYSVILFGAYNGAAKHLSFIVSKTTFPSVPSESNSVEGAMQIKLQHPCHRTYDKLHEESIPNGGIIRLAKACQPYW